MSKSKKKKKPTTGAIRQKLAAFRDTVVAARKGLGIDAVFKRVDTCAAEFVSYTPYLYSTYEQECEAEPTDKRKIVILGSGPNRIGQGIEFDYCCCHASFAFKEEGYETIMINCNPETVSTDYDTSDRLYFEPLTFEDVLEIVDLEKPDGVRRILLLGDSVVEGYGLPEPETLSRQLEDLYPEGSVEVLNFGVSAYCTRAEIELLEVKGLAFDPDIVVLS